MAGQGGALSGGRQQRVCIAQALASAPEFLLMDELCSALDPASINKVEEITKEFAGEVTLVIVTHTMQQARCVSRCATLLLSEHGGPGWIVESGLTSDALSGQ